MTLSQDEGTRNDKADSKTASAHKGEVIEPNHISEEYTVLKSLSNIVPHDPIEKLPEDRSYTNPLSYSTLCPGGMTYGFHQQAPNL